MLVKKLLVLLVIAFVGAGIAFGASTLFFSADPDEVDTVEPEGLIDGDVTAPPVETDEPSPTPTDSPAPRSGGSGGTPVDAQQAAADTSTPRPAGPSSVTSKKGVVVEDSIDEGECDEDNEEDREACLDDLEAEADADEEEAEQEAEEDEERAERDADNDNN